MPESDTSLKAQATITAADIAAGRVFVRNTRLGGQMVKNGKVVPLAKEVLAQLWDALPADTDGAGRAAALRGFVFDKDLQLFFAPNGKAVAPEALKAASEMIVNESQFKILQGTLDLQSAAIDLDTWYQQMKAATKELHLAQGALGSGGWQGVTDSTISRLEQIILTTWTGDGGKIKGLQDFAARLKGGEYGKAFESGAVRVRANLYALAGRATKENEAVQTAKDSGMLEARRVKAAVDNCPDCIEFADRGWVDIEDIEPIGDSVCGVSCHCVIVTRRTPREFVTLPDSKALASVEE